MMENWAFHWIDTNETDTNHEAIKCCKIKCSFLHRKCNFNEAFTFYNEKCFSDKYLHRP